LKKISKSPPQDKKINKRLPANRKVKNAYSFDASIDIMIEIVKSPLDKTILGAQLKVG
jgi:hypothetical protein